MEFKTLENNKKETEKVQNSSDYDDFDIDKEKDIIEKCKLILYAIQEADYSLDEDYDDDYDFSCYDIDRLAELLRARHKSYKTDSKLTCKDLKRLEKLIDEEDYDNICELNYGSEDMNEVWHRITRHLRFGEDIESPEAKKYYVIHQIIVNM